MSSHPSVRDVLLQNVTPFQVPTFARTVIHPTGIVIIYPDGQILNNCSSVCERKRAFCSVLLAMAWDQRRNERAREEEER